MASHLTTLELEELMKAAQLGENVTTEKSVASEERTKEEWKRSGNEFFVKKQYSKARDCYTNGLQQDSNDIDMLSNRCQTNICLRRFILAQKDADAALAINPTHYKAIYRKAKSLCGQNKYEEAKDFLSEAMKQEGIEIENLTDLKKLLKEIEKLNEQSKTGIYDMKLVYNREALNERQGIAEYYNDDLAQLIGPVEVAVIDGKERGLIATEDIKSGQLILACKAFQLLTVNRLSNLTFPKFTDKFAIDKEPVASRESKPLLRTNTSIQFIHSVIHRLQDEPEMLEEVYKLYAGSELEHLRNQSGELIFDEVRVARICDYNSFSVDDLIGLWILPSFINHTCVQPNCTWSANGGGDLMFIRCCRDISKGEELLMSYVSVQNSFKRHERLTCQYAFVCQCRLCIAERAEPQLITETRRLIEDCYQKNTIKAYEETLQKLRKMNKGKDPVLNVHLIKLGINLSDLYITREEYQKVFNILKECHAILQEFMTGSYIMNTVVCHIIQCFMALNRVRDPDLKYWIKELKEASARSFGTPKASEFIFPQEFVYSLKCIGLW